MAYRHSSRPVSWLLPYTLATYPEAKPINPSPWYAFKVVSEDARRIEVYLHYAHHKHRYPPKISNNGDDWSLLAEDQYQVILDGKAIRMKLKTVSLIC